MVNREIIEDIFTRIINTNIKVKCSRNGTRDSSGPIHGQGEAPRFESTGEPLSAKELNEIADAMAERWGLEVSIDSKGKREISKTKFSLWDDEHKTLIRLNKYLKHNPSWVDFTNNGQGAYDLDEVLRYYDTIPSPMKDAMGGVLFETSNGSPYNTVYDGQYDVVNPIVLTAPLFEFKDYLADGHNLQRTMYHEGGHASANIMPKAVIDVLRKSSVSKNGFSKGKLTTDAERKIYDDYFNTSKYHYPISDTKEYDKSMSENKRTFSSEYSSTAFLKLEPHRKREEDLAEALSMASFRNLKDKSNARIDYGGGKVVDYDTFVKDHEGTFKFASDFLDGKIKYTGVNRLFLY